jgi:hypothetical protein
LHILSVASLRASIRNVDHHSKLVVVTTKCILCQASSMLTEGLALQEARRLADEAARQRFLAEEARRRAEAEAQARALEVGCQISSLPQLFGVLASV